MDAEWVSVGLTGVSVIATGFAWWRSNVSKQAKAEAEEARDNARRQTEAAEQAVAEARRQADAAMGIIEEIRGLATEVQKHAKLAKQHAEAAESIADGVGQVGRVTERRFEIEHPPLQLVHQRSLLYCLVNNSDQDVHIERIDNEGQFVKCEIIAAFDIPAGGQTDVLLGGAMEKRMPPNLLVKLEGVDKVITVPIPSRR